MAMKTMKFSISKRSRINDIDEDNTAEVNMLPDPIVADILSRVPAKTVIRCMAVNKTWLSLIDNSFFAKQHFSRSPVCPLLVCNPSRKPYSIIMQLVEGQTVPDLVTECKLNSRMEFFNVMRRERGFDHYMFLQLNDNPTSCEGVVCCAPHRGSGRDHVLICNPVTGESVALNVVGKPTAALGYDQSIFIGLGFSHVDQKFKLLCCRQSFDYAFPELWDVGTREWRPAVVPSVPKISFTRQVSEVVYVNGAIYWRYVADPFICYFDFDTVVLQVVPLPEKNGVTPKAASFVTMNMSMGVLNDTLCVSLVCPDYGCVELWILPKEGGCVGNWRKIFAIESTATRMDHSGLLLRRGLYKPIKYLNCGNVLLHDWQHTFFLYDPISKNENLFRVLEHSYLENLSTDLNLRVVPHVPSLISLKKALNVEDESTTMLKDYLRILN